MPTSLPSILLLRVDHQGDGCAAEPAQFAGVVGSDEEVNIMTGTKCTGTDTCG